MSRVVKLFFTLILIGATISSPVFAEEPSVPSTEPSTEKTSETTEVAASKEPIGEEWSGIIEEPAKTPANTTVSEPANPTPATSEPVNSQPATQPTPTTPVRITKAPSTPSTVTNSTAETDTPSSESTSSEETSPAETITEEATPAEALSEETLQEDSKDDTVMIPNTSRPETTHSDDVSRIVLLVVTCIAIIYFSFIEIWGLTKLAKIHKYEKSAKNTIKISRAS